MALWFDAKGKSYAGDHTSSWLKAYVEQQLEQNEKQCRENLRSEEEQRKAADTALQDTIEAETKECMAAVEAEAVARQAGGDEIQNALDAHQADKSNSHEVTKEQVGLGNADNTADLDKPISTATQAALNAETAEREKADADLTAVIEEEAAVRAAALNTEAAARGEADADLMTAIGDETEAREAADSALQNRIEQEAGERRIAVETEAAARQTEDGKLQSALNSHNSDKSNPHEITKAQVGLGNVDNTSDLNKPISTATQAAIDAEESARETAVTELETAISEKAAKTEVLTKTNTTAFTPSSNYHPATKKYVDDSVSAAGGGDMLKAAYDTNNNGKVDSADHADDADKLGGQSPSYYASASSVTAKANTSAVLTKTNTTAFTPSSNYHPATKKYVDDSVSDKANTSAVLTKTNTTSFTPSSNYHPATKKYVDDSVSAVASAAVFPEKPTLTALTPVGTTVGSSGWTGTGEFNTDASSNNSHNVFSSHIGAGYMRMNLKLAAGEDWQDWSPYYDKDGEEFPFYYSEARGLYDGIIPDEGLTLQQAINKIRWVYRRKPDIIIYGSFGGVLTTRTDEQEQTTYVMTTDIGRMWRCGTGDYGDNSDTFVYRIMIKNIKLTELGLPASLIAKIALVSDVIGNTKITGNNAPRIMQIMRGTATAPDICSIDNWEA